MTTYTENANLTNEPTVTATELTIMTDNWKAYLKSERLVADRYDEEDEVNTIVFAETNFDTFVACLNGVIRDKAYTALYAKDPQGSEERMIYRAFYYAAHNIDVSECLDREIPNMVKSMRFTLKCIG